MISVSWEKYVTNEQPSRLSRNTISHVNSDAGECRSWSNKIFLPVFFSLLFSCLHLLICAGKKCTFLFCYLIKTHFSPCSFSAFCLLINYRNYTLFLLFFSLQKMLCTHKKHFFFSLLLINDFLCPAENNEKMYKRENSAREKKTAHTALHQMSKMFLASTGKTSLTNYRNFS